MASQNVGVLIPGTCTHMTLQGELGCNGIKVAHQLALKWR